MYFSNNILAFYIMYFSPAHMWSTLHISILCYCLHYPFQCNV